MIGAYSALAGTLCYLGDFKTSRQYAIRGVEIWRSGGRPMQNTVAKKRARQEDVDSDYRFVDAKGEMPKSTTKLVSPNFSPT